MATTPMSLPNLLLNKVENQSRLAPNSNKNQKKEFDSCVVINQKGEIATLCVYTGDNARQKALLAIKKLQLQGISGLSIKWLKSS
jgi:demethoxyubiquinone hydroxylase (CLK1/Coq7/Cat5 family)